MTIRTFAQLNTALSEELAWRKRELTGLKFLVEKPPRAGAQTILLRAAIALLYAHWEGFIKAAGNAYLEFVSFQRLKNSQLAKNFLALSVRSILRQAGQSNKMEDHIRVVEFFETKLHDAGAIPYKNAISTKSNLSSVVLSQIISTLGLDYAPYTTKSEIVDEKLLDSRNSIAHGEYLRVDSSDYAHLHEQVIAMLEEFRTQIENAAAMKAYAHRAA